MSRFTDILNAWYGSTDEVNRMARDMVRGGMFDGHGSFGDGDARDTAYNLLDFLEKPWHWNAEHAWWVANDWPDDVASWERGQNIKWACDPTTMRLEYLRGEIVNERISMTEIIELQGMADSIDPSDVLLLQWAGVPEGGTE